MALTVEPSSSCWVDLSSWSSSRFVSEGVKDRGWGGSRPGERRRASHDGALVAHVASPVGARVDETTPMNYPPATHLDWTADAVPVIRSLPPWCRLRHQEVCLLRDRAFRSPPRPWSRVTWSGAAVPESLLPMMSGSSEFLPVTWPSESFGELVGESFGERASVSAHARCRCRGRQARYTASTRWGSEGSSGRGRSRARRDADATSATWATHHDPPESKRTTAPRADDTAETFRCGAPSFTHRECRHRPRPNVRWPVARSE